jgi:hypothetical protein
MKLVALLISAADTLVTILETEGWLMWTVSALSICKDPFA